MTPDQLNSDISQTQLDFPVDSQIPTTNLPNSVKVLIAALLTITVTALSALAYFIFQPRFLDVPETDTSIEEVSSDIPYLNQPVTEMSSEVINNSDMKVYEDQTFGVSFKFPHNWKENCSPLVISDSWQSANICDLSAPGTVLDHGRLISGAYLVVGVEKPNTNYSNLSESVEYSVSQRGYTATPMTINNINGYNLVSNEYDQIFVFENKGYFISVNWLNLQVDDPYYTDLQKILQSFQTI